MFDDPDPRLSLIYQVGDDAILPAAPVKSAWDATYTSQDSLIQSMLSHVMLPPIRIRSAFFLH